MLNQLNLAESLSLLLVTWTQCIDFAVVLLQLRLLHWGMLCEVRRDCTGSYILLQQNITLILAFCDTSKMSLLRSPRWLHYEGLQ